MDNKGLIGDRGVLPWHIPEDLAWFKQQTLNHSIIMGRSTWNSLGKPLPQRKNIVLSRDATFKAEGVIVAHSIAEARTLCLDATTYVIGGANVFAQFLLLADRLIVTRIDSLFTGDTYFPDYNRDEWTLVSSTKVNSQTGFSLSFNVFTRN